MKPIIFTGLLLVFLLSGSCAPRQDFNTRLNSIVKPYLFDIVGWELGAIRHEVNQWTFGRYQKIDDGVRVVWEYYSAIERAKTLRSEITAVDASNVKGDLPALEAELNRLQEEKLASQSTVERIIEKQVRDALAQQSIFNPIVGFRVSFPPVNFRLEKPPYLLVVSPRDRIASIREITLQQNLNLEEIAVIEAEADRLGVSSLVTEIGGLSVPYPTIVEDEASLRYTIDTVVEEWLHQYLFFKPLGFLYALDLVGASRNYEIATINETLASIVSKEIGSIIYQKYYSQYQTNAQQDQVAEAAFDFNREMREIRRTVDAYLARGEIALAEEFMEEKRQFLASMNYYIRRLNQAYFAFHGTYADSPTSISPIGLELKKLRAQSASLKDFLDTVSTMTSRQDLRDSIK